MKVARFTILLAIILAGGALAQDAAYPGKPVRILVGYAAGGGNDIIVRVMHSSRSPPSCSSRGPAPRSN